MNKKEIILGSRGMWEYTRIGRPDVIYDQRATYVTDREGFEKSMMERRGHANDVNPVQVVTSSQNVI